MDTHLQCLKITQKVSFYKISSEEVRYKIHIFPQNSHFEVISKNYFKIEYLWYHMNHCSSKKDSTSKTQKNRSDSSFPYFVIIDKILSNLQGNKSQNEGNASQKHHSQIFRSVQVHLVWLILQEWIVITQLQKCKANAALAYLFKAIAVKKHYKLHLTHTDVF